MALGYRGFYNGQDLHIVRNNKEFLLNDYIVNGSVTPTYSIEYPKNTSVATEGIVIENNGDGIFSITANPYSQDTNITNIKVKITDNTTTLYVRIYIHNSVTTAWLSPSPMTIYKNHDDLRLGVFVKFDDDNIANVSWYNGLTWSDISLPSYLNIDPNTGRVTVTGDYPTELPNGYTPTTYQVGCCLPESLFASCVSGFINVALDEGSLAFHKGVPSNLIRKQVIILSDGFLNTERDLFKAYVTQALEKLESPWNLINNINYWSYFLPSRESGGIVEGNYIKLKPYDTTKPDYSKMASIDGYSKVLERIFHELIVLNVPNKTLGDYLGVGTVIIYPEFTNFIPWEVIFGSNYLNLALSDIKVKNLQSGSEVDNVNILTVNDICEYVGLPGSDDQSKNISTLRNNWVSFGIEDFRVEGDPTVVDGDRYLSVFTLEMWKRIFPYTTPSYPDTSFSTYRTEGHVFDLNAIRNYVDGNIVSMININKFVSNFIYEDNNSTYPVGLAFFQTNGMPVLDDNYLPKNGNNLVLLSKIPRYLTMGFNKRVPYRITGINKSFDNRISIISADPELYITMKYANSDLSNPDYIIPSNINFPPALNADVKNAIFHEFSHSHYLLDEYTNEANDLNTESQNVKQSYSKYTLESNLQTLYDLQNIRPPLTGKTGTGDNIKWLWPRIVKLTFTDSLLQNDGLGNYLVAIKKISGVSDFDIWFQIGETILLRKRNLFEEYHYFRFKINDILDSSTGIQTFKLQLIGDANGNTNFDANDYPADSIIILPLWKNNQEYYSLIAQDVVEHINTTNEALVLEDDPASNHAIQKPNLPSSIIGHFKIPENIIGLYAGGGGIYNAGLYHPTGFCIMRKTDVGHANYYCQVCKYILIDAFDPIQHPRLDAGYTDFPLTN